MSEDLIDKIIKKEHILEDKWYKNFPIDTRYPTASLVIALLAHHQLNSEKNRIKPRIEEMTYFDIFEKIKEEIHELMDEMGQTKWGMVTGSLSSTNKRRILEETGDVAAMLAGLLAKVLKEE